MQEQANMDYIMLFYGLIYIFSEYQKNLNRIKVQMLPKAFSRIISKG